MVKGLQFEGKDLKLQIWDTPGQERFASITSFYYRGANGIMMVFDITRRESFDILRNKIIQTVRSQAQENVKILVVGSMLDKQESRQVSYEEAMAFAQEINAPYLECSAKTGQNINEVFE